jgi:hypothetical protein
VEKHNGLCCFSIQQLVNFIMFIDCLHKPKPSWQETFMSNIRTLDL